MPGDAEDRFLIATAVAHYRREPGWDRPGLVAAREEIIDLFTGAMDYKHVSDLGLDPTREQLTTRLREFCRSPQRQRTDMLAIYIACHGEVLEGSGDHVLLTTDTDPDDIADAMPTVELARKMLLGTRVRRVLLMLDTCYSGSGGNELTAAALTRLTQDWEQTTGSGLVVITSTQPAEQAQAGAFPRLLRRAVEGLPTAGHTPATLALDAVIAAMNTDSKRPGFQTISANLTHITGGVPPFLPNPRHDPQLTEVDLAIQQAAQWEAQNERRDIEYQTRLLVRAMGYHGPTPQWLFSGRHTALADITGWLTNPDSERPLLAVTAGPGSGKTAVLGLIAAVTHPDRRVTVPLHALGLRAAAIPPAGVVDVVIYAQSLTTDQVLRGMAAAARVDADKPGELLEALSGRVEPLTVLIDALDEASDPDDLTRRLLQPLAVHARSRLRLLVGTRPHLLKNLGLRREDSIDLDTPRYADLDALTTYVARGLLDAVADSPYQGQPPRTIRAIARAVAEASDPSFLVARITSSTLAAGRTIPDHRDPAWHRTLPRLPNDAMRRDLETRLGQDAHRARDLLRPLAFAEGQGLPWEDIWAPLASHIAGRTYTDEDLFWLRHHAGSYVIEATETGRSAYRLYHQALAEHLREAIDDTAIHQAFTQVLSARVPLTPDGSRDWSRAHPYALQYLATHAARGGVLAGVIADTDYLVHANPEELLIALHHVSTDEGRLTGAIYRASAAKHRHRDPTHRRRALAIDAARFGASEKQFELSATLQWVPRWATGQETHTALRATLAGHEFEDSEGVRHFVAFAVIDGQPAVILGDSEDETVRVWDLATGALRTTLTGHEDEVCAIACTTVDGRAIAVTGGRDRTVRVWDLATGALRTTLTGHEDEVCAIACTMVAGQSVAVTGDFVGKMRVWDLATGTLLTTLTGHEGWVWGIECTEIDSKPVAITIDCTGYASGRDEVLRVWDLATGALRATLTGHKRSVYSVACTEVGGRPVAVSGGADGTVRVWDLATGTLSMTLTGHTDGADGVACTVVDGHAVAVTVSADRTARVWDLSTGVLHATLTGHEDYVQAVACSVVDSRPVAVTGGRDRTVRVWDLTTGALLTILTGHEAEVCEVACTVVDGQPVAVTSGSEATKRLWHLSPSVNEHAATGHIADIEAVACTVVDGQPVVVTGSQDRTVRVRDLTTGTLRATLTGHDDWVLAVACSVVEGHPVAVTGGRDRTVRVWDLTTGALRATLTGHTGMVEAVACTVVDGQPIAVTGSNSNVLMWNLTTETLHTTLVGHEGSVEAVACTEVDGRPVAITRSMGDKPLWVWDLTTGTLRATLTGHEGWVHSIECTTVSGQPIAVTGSHDETVRVWDLTTGALRATLTGHGGSVEAVACTVVDGRPVAVSGGRDGIVRVWDLATGDLRGALTGHKGWLSAVACTVVDSQPIAVTRDERTVRVWDLKSSAALAVLDLASTMPGRLYVGPAQELVIPTGWDLVVIERRLSR